MSARWAVLITGCREWRDREAVHSVINSCPANTVFIHGDHTTGCDRIVREHCIETGRRCVAVPAPWGYFRRLHQPRAAGPARNGWMILDVLAVYRAAGWSTRVHAFPMPNGCGTQDCMRQARKHGFEVTEHGRTE